MRIKLKIVDDFLFRNFKEKKKLKIFVFSIFLLVYLYDAYRTKYIKHIDSFTQSEYQNQYKDSLNTYMK